MERLECLAKKCGLMSRMQYHQRGVSRGKAELTLHFDGLFLAAA